MRFIFSFLRRRVFFLVPIISVLLVFTSCTLKKTNANSKKKQQRMSGYSNDYGYNKLYKRNENSNVKPNKRSKKYSGCGYKSNKKKKVASSRGVRGKSNLNGTSVKNSGYASRSTGIVSNGVVGKDINNNVNKDKICRKSRYKHFGIIISGPSGVGKTTMIKGLARKHDNLFVSVSATTRKMREGEVDGRDYYFLTKDEFNRLVKQNIEYDNKFENYYGTPLDNYFNAINSGKDPIFALSTRGMENAKRYKNTDFITIFIMPSRKDILEERLGGRNTESKEQLAMRLKEADGEMKQAYKYDYILYTGDNEIGVDIKTLEAIYLAEQRKREGNCK